MEHPFRDTPSVVPSSFAWKRNAQRATAHLALSSQEVFGPPKKPDESKLTHSAFDKIVKERQLVGIYAPPTHTL